MRLERAGLALLLSLVVGCSSEKTDAPMASDGAVHDSKGGTAGLGGGQAGGSPANDAASSGGSAGADAGNSDCVIPEKPSDAIDVTSHGAKGDGVADDTDAINAAVAQVPTGGTLYLPEGVYRVRTTQDGCGTGMQDMGVHLKSNMTMLMHPAAVLKAIANDCDGYGIVTVTESENVTIAGGTIEGDRAEHLGTTGEWGMGIYLAEAMKVSIRGVTIRECWGDGILVGYKFGPEEAAAISHDVTICGVVTDHNRRCGIAAVGVSGLVVSDSVMKNSDGTSPRAGFCGEPDPPNGLMENVTLRNSQFLDNYEGGGYFGGPAPAVNRSCTLENSTISGNGTYGWDVGGNYSYDQTYGLSGIQDVIQNNTIEDNGWDHPNDGQNEGLRLWNASQSSVTGNVFRHNRHWALAIEGAPDNTISKNKFEDSDQAAIYLRWYSNDTQIADNVCSGAGAIIDGDGAATGLTISNNAGCQNALP